MRRFCSSRTIVSQTLVELPSQQVHRTFIVSQTQVTNYRLTNESATRTSSSHNLKCSNFIVSQTQVQLELRRLTNESVSSSDKRKCNFIISQTKVQLHRLTNESATSSSHKRSYLKGAGVRRLCARVVLNSNSSSTRNGVFKLVRQGTPRKQITT